MNREMDKSRTDRQRCTERQKEGVKDRQAERLTDR